MTIAVAMTAQGTADRAPARAELLCADAAGDPAFVEEWRDLAANAAEANPFFAPSALLPALSAFAGAKARLACIRDGGELIGLLPVAPKFFYARAPVAYWQTWTHPHCYFAAPLVRDGAADAAFPALYSLLCDGRDGRAFLRMGRIARDSALYAAAQAAARNDGRICYEAGAVERAMLSGGASAEATLAVHLRQKKRKELRRLRNRLEELGAVSARNMTDTDDLGAWTRDFLALEDRGWKSASGTSLNSSQADADWFAATLAGARDAGELHFLRLDLGDRAIAMLVSLRAKGEVYSLKICHDPEFDRFSPGVMIEIEAMKAFLDDPEFRFADSCAAPDHSMINGLWRARRVITGLNVSGRGLGAKSALSLCRALESARARIPVRAAP